MRKMVLGRTGIEVSAVGLGGVQFSKIPDKEVAAVLEAGRQEGITFLETAHGYFDSEEKMGRALRGRRDGLVIASKNGKTDGREFMRCLEESLRRLRCEYFDIYQLHGVDTLGSLRQRLAKGGAVEAARKAIEQGKIRSLGITSHSMDICLRVLKDDLFDTVQYPISLINTEIPRSGMLALARRHNVGLIAMKPMGGGRIDTARLGLGYVYRLRGVVPVVGVETPRQVRELAAVARRPPRLGARDWAEIRRIRRTLGKTFCRACRYCEPCPRGISIFRLMYFPIYVKQMGAERFVKDGLPDWMRQAETCTGCRKCEVRCPFHLRIVAGMQASLAQARALHAELAQARSR